MIEQTSYNLTNIVQVVEISWMFEFLSQKTIKKSVSYRGEPLQ